MASGTSRTHYPLPLHLSLLNTLVASQSRTREKKVSKCKCPFHPSIPQNIFSNKIGIRKVTDGEHLRSLSLPVMQLLVVVLPFLSEI